MQDQHLRPVPEPAPHAASEQSSTNEDGTPETKATTKGPKRPRATKALPTDRLKFDAQKAALRAISVASENGRKAVNAADMAARMKVVATTAGLNNAFFVESNLITREGRGLYKPTPAANEFARTFGFDERRAGRTLREPLSTTWYFRAVRQQIEGMGPTSRETLIELLCHEAEASPEHQLQLGSLLAWLEYADLIVLEGGVYKVAADIAGQPDETPSAKTENQDDATGSATTTGQADVRTGSETPKKDQAGLTREAETVLAFNFDFALTKDDLKELSADQIRELFDAVGKVTAIKATIKTED